MNYHLSPTGKKQITVIPGDGIGPECINAARRIIEATGVSLEWEECHAGARVFKQGIASGVPQETLDSIGRTRVVLKGPLETPIGYGEKSANVTLRKFFETYANIRPVRELPGVPTPFTGHKIDLVVIRENVEDLYAGIEHVQTPGVAQCLKLISRKGCEKIVRLAFEFARAEGRQKITCATKANIMKQTEGLLKRTFEEIAPEYPDIAANHILIDNCAHQLVRQPGQFDIILTTNMNGDIISDLTSGLIGGLGFAASANLGNNVAMFEAVHGSAPSFAGRNIINPTAVILSSVLMLRHLGEFEAAAKIKNAVLFTLAEGKAQTFDITGSEERCATTTEYTDRIIRHLGDASPHWAGREYKPIQLPQVSEAPDLVKPEQRRVIGVDIFVEAGGTAEALGESLEQLAVESPLKLKMISNRGTKVYPPTGTLTDCVDHWRCRFVLRDGQGEVNDADVLDLLQRVASRHRWMHVEKLQEFNGQPGFTKAQGED